MPADIHYLTEKVPPPDDIGSFDGGGDGPNNGGMNERLANLEVRLDTTLPTLATKADVADAKTAIADSRAALVMWIAGSGIAVVAVILTAIFATWGRSSTPPQTFVIQVPSALSAPAATVAPAVTSQPSPAK